MSQSPLSADVDDSEVQKYLDAWEPLHQSILTGGSFSGRERNCCFLNTGSQRFADVSASSGLNHIEDGRAVAVTDWDQDGDLDLWITNRNSPRIRFLRNDMPTSNSSISIRLEGNPEQKCPRDAAGARVTLRVKDGSGNASQRMQSLYLGDSFVSQSSKWLQFGVRADESIESVSVRWPGNAQVETFPAENDKGTRLLSTGGRYLLQQGTRIATPVARSPGVQNLTPSIIEPLPLTDSGRLKLTLLENPLSELAFLDSSGKAVKLTPPFERPLLVVFWASWCSPCREELQELSQTGLDAAQVIALNIESATSATAPPHAELKKILDQIAFPGRQGIATRKTIDTLNSRHLESIYVRKELPLPVSFLIDEEGHLRVVYKGPMNRQQVLRDILSLDAVGPTAWSMATPFPGRWSEDVIQGDPVVVARIHIQNGNPDDAKDYLEWYLANTSAPLTNRNDESSRVRRRNLGLVHYELGRIAQLQNQPSVALKHATTAFEFHPKHVPSLLAIISYHISQADFDAAMPYCKKAMQLAGGNARVEYQVAMVYAGRSDFTKAIEHYENAVRSSDGQMIPATNNLAWLRATHPDEQYRDGPEAMRLALKSCELTGYRDYRLFDTLAAAYAESGDFDQAIVTCQRGIKLAMEKSDNRTAGMLESRIDLYRKKTPYRDIK